MSEITAVSTDLDLLAERVERAATLVQSMREDKRRLESERDELARRVHESEQRLQGQDVTALLAEVQTLRKEQRDWQSERREVAGRIEALVKKLERLEA
jgi:DNA repair exonuclease SbcCD ATPase subunit